MQYLYAIAAELGDIAELRGVQGEPLQRLPFHDAVVVAGDVSAAPAIAEETLRAQDALVRQLHDRAAALLPMRFGMTVDDAESLPRALDARVIERLAAVRGCEQMVVRVVGAESTVHAEAAARAEGAASGTAYLLALAQKHRPSSALSDIASAPVAMARDVRVEPATQPGVHGSVYHLIERGRGHEYRGVVEHAARALPDVRVIITGPSPAYAFA
jgi:hypothetical protein